MKGSRVWLFPLAAIALFLAANRAAYQGFFSGDDLDNIAWTRELPARDYLTALAAPRYLANHFRPVGHATFALLGSTVGARFPAYVATLHLLHFATAAALFALLIRLRFAWPAAAAGSAFFLYQMALFDAVWKPMYLFDVWCGLFCALALHSWVSRRFLVAIVLLWLAIKSKEHAVMAVAVLTLYEILLGERRWKWVALAAALASIFALQALTENRVQGQAYTLSFALPSLVKTASFYASHLMIAPFAGLLLLAGTFWARDRRAWWGLASAVLFVIPLLLLPGRLFSAYLYVSMLGVAIAIAAMSARAGWRITAAAGSIWLLFNFIHMRQMRRAELAAAAESKSYFEQVTALAAREPGLRRFVFAGYPKGLQSWGVQGALRIAYRTLGLEVRPADGAGLDKLFASGAVGVLSWNRANRNLSTAIRQTGERNASYVDIAGPLPVWQFGEGWYDPEGAYRWTKPVAKVSLRRPADASAFELRVNVGEAFIASVRTATVRVTIDGQDAGTASFSRPGWETARLTLPPGLAADVTVEFHASPGFRPESDPRTLGIAIGAFGFR